MQARRVLLLSAIGLVSACSATMLGACGGGDNTVVYVFLEAGTADAKKPTTVGDADPDPGVVSCDPQGVSKFTFKVPPAHSGDCTDQEIEDLYTGCAGDMVTTSTCEAAKAAASKCASCLLAAPNAAIQRPWVVYTDKAVPFFNSGLCQALIAGESAATDCSIANGQVTNCVFSACLDPCLPLYSQVDRDSFFNAFETCQNAAVDNGSCTDGLTTLRTQKCQKAFADGDPTYGFCTSEKDEQGVDLDEHGLMVRVAKLACGSAPDGGAPDAGPDADAGDAGPDADLDASDADADTGTN